MSANTTQAPHFSDNTGLRHYVYSSPAFYYSTRSALLDSLSDETLSLVSPIITYWVYSLFFHILDSIDAPWIHKYRIHESAEVKTRNLVTRSSCFYWVVLQHIIQGVFVYYMNSPSEIPSPLIDVMGVRNAVEYGAKLLLGKTLALRLLHAYGPAIVWIMYWWAIPVAQLLFGMFCIDTWQYFLHRAFHENKFLYRKFHSWHHRLYVPYAYGALYNHPVEGLLLDTVGGFIAHSLSLMSVRQSIVLWCFATMKTVDDHCGYRLSINPLQAFFVNNADYHDIHHQKIGMKSNFSQPFFVHWDALLGTRMTRKELGEKQHRTK